MLVLAMLRKFLPAFLFEFLLIVLAIAMILGGSDNPNAKLLSLTARDVGVADALDMICLEAGLRWQVDEEFLMVMITPLRKGE